MKDDKGFSLIELIIVVAIMSILSAVLSPQLMRYIKNSRVSTDKNNCESIKTSINTTFADADAYEEVMGIASQPSFSGCITFSFNGSKPVDYSVASLKDGLFDKELNRTVKEWPKVKTDGADKFYCRIIIDTINYTIAKVEVQTEPFTP